MKYSTVLLCVFAIGCGSKKDGLVEVVPVSGKVLVKGQPAEGARVVFYPISEELKGKGMPVPAGTTDDTGEFQLQSFRPDDGAPVGDFRVTVVWLEPTPPNADPEMFRAKDRLQGRYSNPDTTKLTATVPDGGVQLPPFELQ